MGCGWQMLLEVASLGSGSVASAAAVFDALSTVLPMVDDVLLLLQGQRQGPSRRRDPPPLSCSALQRVTHDAMPDLQPEAEAYAWVLQGARATDLVCLCLTAVVGRAGLACVFLPSACCLQCWSASHTLDPSTQRHTMPHPRWQPASVLLP